MASSTDREQRPAKPRRHLIDFDAPRPAPDPEAERRLRRVQQWIMSTLAVGTILHLSAGSMLAAILIDDPRPGAEVGLNVMAGAWGVVAVVAGLAIHRRRVLSWWLLLGALPTPIGLWLTLA